MRRAARNLATSSRKLLWALKKKESARGKLVDVESGVDGALHISDAIGQGECDLLNRGRSGFAHVIAGDGNRVPLGDVLIRPGKQVGNDAHGLRRREDVRAAGDVFLEHVVLHRAGELADVGALAAGDGDVKRQQDRRRRVDGHRGRNLGQIDAIEEALHVLDRIDGHADLSDFTHGERVVGIQADLGGQIECHRKPGSAVRQQVFVTLVGFLGVAHAGVLAHGPEPAAIHGGLDAAGKGIVAGIADLVILVTGVQIRGRVQRADWDVRGSLGIGGCGEFRLVGHEEEQPPPTSLRRTKGFSRTAGSPDFQSVTSRPSWLRVQPFFHTLQNELAPNQVKVSVKIIATPTRPRVVWPAW